jgi:hypothetical protein
MQSIMCKVQSESYLGGARQHFPVECNQPCHLFWLDSLSVIKPLVQRTWPSRSCLLISYFLFSNLTNSILKEMSQGSKSHSAPSIPKYFNYFPYFHEWNCNVMNTSRSRDRWVLLLQPMKAQYTFYLGSYLGSLKLHGFINGMLRIP